MIEWKNAELKKLYDAEASLRGRGRGTDAASRRTAVGSGQAGPLRCSSSVYVLRSMISSWSPFPMPPWYAIWTRSRHEKAVEEHLAAEGRSRSSCPPSPRWSRWKDRKKQDRLAAVSRLLLRALRPRPPASPSSPRPALRASSAFDGKPAPIPDLEIDSIRRLVNERTPVRSVPAHQGGHHRRGHSRPAQGRRRQPREESGSCPPRAFRGSDRPGGERHSRRGGYQGLLVEVYDPRLTRVSD